jgi:predicted DCC family thiol-disulfide oxidoreductase YuxK
MNNTGSILLFDGGCNLCNGLVKFIVKRDKKGKIKFASLQSDTGKSLLSKAGLGSDSIDTVVYFSRDKTHLRSSAVLNLLKDLGGGWKLFYALIIIPAFIRDFFYNIIAENRFKLFGRSDNCEIS